MLQTSRTGHVCRRCQNIVKGKQNAEKTQRYPFPSANAFQEGRSGDVGRSVV